MIFWDTSITISLVAQCGLGTALLMFQLSVAFPLGNFNLMKGVMCYIQQKCYCIISKLCWCFCQGNSFLYGKISLYLAICMWLNEVAQRSLWFPFLTVGVVVCFVSFFSWNLICLSMRVYNLFLSIRKKSLSNTNCHECCNF